MPCQPFDPISSFRRISLRFAPIRATTHDKPHQLNPSQHPHLSAVQLLKISSRNNLRLCDQQRETILGGFREHVKHPESFGSKERTPDQPWKVVAPAIKQRILAKAPGNPPRVCDRDGGDKDARFRRPGATIWNADCRKPGSPSIDQVRDQGFVPDPIHPSWEQTRARIARADEGPACPSVLAKPAIKRNGGPPDHDFEVDSIRADAIDGLEISRTQNAAGIPGCIAHQAVSPDRSDSCTRFSLATRLVDRDLCRTVCFDGSPSAEKLAAGRRQRSTDRY